MKTNVKSKKGGNFLETIGEFVAPTGWEGFATAAGLLALDSANSALKRGKKSSKKMKGGLPLPPPPSLFTNTFFKESRQPEKDYLESFIENYKKQGTIIDKYAEKRLLDYFNKLKTNQEKLEAKRKLHVFLNDPSINSNKSNKIKKILESIQL
jgi:hypothetical protein